MESIGLRQTVPPSSTESVIPSGSADENAVAPPVVEPENPDVTMPSVGDGAGTTTGTTPGVAGEMSIVDIKKLPKQLTLSSTDFTASAGEVVKLSVSGGTGSYRWVSENPAVATVSDKGIITGVSGGSTSVYVTDGKAMAVCIARVNGPAAGADDGKTPAGAATPVLSSTDFTLPVGETTSLQVTGTASAVTWASENAAVATVSNGTVKGVAKGNTTITATVDGKTLKCIARIT